MRAVFATLSATVTLAAAAGCDHAGPCDGVSCAPACPRDATVDRSGRCACVEGDVPLLGACVPLPVSEAFCGPAARVESLDASGGCVFRECGAGQWLDVVAGACVPWRSIERGGSIGCREPAAVLVESGHAACVAPEAACPRGTRPRPVDARDGKRAPMCERPLPCPPGSLADGSLCRPVVLIGGRAGNRVDVGAWAALALGIHGGVGSSALCQPLAQQPSAFGHVPSASEPAVDAAAGAAPLSVRVALAILLPDQDVSRVHAEVRAREASGRPLSTAAEALVTAAVGTALEALRGLGGEASAASVELEVTCAVGEAPM